MIRNEFYFELLNKLDDLKGYIHCQTNTILTDVTTHKDVDEITVIVYTDNDMQRVVTVSIKDESSYVMANVESFLKIFNSIHSINDVENIYNYIVKQMSDVLDETEHVEKEIDKLFRKQKRKEEK